MNGALAVIDEIVRLYSKEPRVPADTVAPEHWAIHQDLERWGRWNRERKPQGKTKSIESRFDNDGGRQAKKAVVSLPPDALLPRIEAVVLALPEQHSETLVMYYVKRWEPKTICWANALQYEDFARWMSDCRTMVITGLNAG